MKRVPYLLSLFLVLGAAGWPAADNGPPTLTLTYSDGHVQTVRLDRDVAMIATFRFGEKRPLDLTGQWRMRMQDPYAYYVSDVVLAPIGSGKWQVIRTLRETNHNFHGTRIGTTDSDCIVTLEGGNVIMTCEGYDPNPSARGRYHQEFQGEFDSQGVLRGGGRHEGVLDHSTSWEMSRS